MSPVGIGGGAMGFNRRKLEDQHRDPPRLMVGEQLGR
jgi:hypothetical protein